MIRTTKSIGPTAHLKGIIPLILITATLLVGGMAQASPSPTVTAASPAAGTALPDLVITDVWSDGVQICYQVRNIGDGAGPPGHETRLLVDGQQDIDQIGLELAPGERLARCFAWQWLCTPLQDEVQVCADAYKKVAEADENNNCREELWTCDQTAPQILEGPFVSELSQTTAALQWKTDEASDSTVQYDDQAGLFGTEQSSPLLETDHAILLTGLNPYTLYQYRVRSTDESGNTVESAPGFFETLPVEDSVPPTVQKVSVEKEEGEAVHYKFRVPASDNACLERVELYLDEELIGTAYTPAGTQVGRAGEAQASGIELPVFEFDVMPGVLQMPYAEFFQEHMIWATAIDCSGGIGGGGGPWEPAPNPFDGELTFLAPEEDDVLWIPGAVVPAGTTVNIAVYAAEFEAEICPPFGDGDCTHGPIPVDRVEFYVDDVLLHTSYSAAEQYEHSYSWDVGGLGRGSYQIEVRAFAADGRELREERTMGIESGAARLSIRRTASRDAEGFLIRLLVTNVGTASAYLEAIQDNLTGFQAVNNIEAHYAVSVAYDVTHNGCDVTIATYDTIGTPYELAPDDYLAIEYRAVPILYPSMPWAFRSDDYAIGSEPLVVTRREAGALRTEAFSRPAALVEVGAARQTLGDAVAVWRGASSYLIVTHPSFLHAFSPAADADRLLSSLASLATLKHGILGYLTGVVDRHLVDQYIEEWGSTMAGSDGTAGGYLGDGYLLIVGETEIVPAATVDLDPWYKEVWDVGPIHLTDVYYADTHSNLIDPELMVGRIIGNNAQELSIPVVTQILLERGTAGSSFDRSDALVMIGFPRSRDGGSTEVIFLQEAWEVSDYLKDHGTTVTWLQTPDYATQAEAIDRFLALVPDKDIVHMIGHGSPWSLDDLLWDDFPPRSDPFGDANPFAYGSACLTGRYSGEWRGEPIATSLAEAFLLRGAAAYLGSTEISWAPANQNIAGSIYYHWDPGRSIGSVIKEVKTARGSSGGLWDYIEDVWTVEYQIFGDPQLGEGVTSRTAAQPSASTEAGGVPPTIEIEIPDYTVQQYDDGGIQVRIPGGFWVQVPDQPMVPTYDYSLHVDKGTRVQDVRLVSRSGLETATGLEIPVFDPREAAPTAASALQDLGGSEWWPDQDFDWSIKDNPDGSSELLMQIYPFYYNPLTTDVRFYKKYTFAIQSSSSLAQVGRLTTDRPAYEAGAPVAIDLWIDNPGPAQDITVEAAVKALSSDRVVDGLLLRSLKGLSGPATYSLEWDSDGQAAGDYYVEANIRDAAGNVLDQAIVNLTIGIAAVETANWSVTPEWFRAGDQITIGFDVINTGTVPISGTAAIQLLEDSSVVAEFSQVILNLAPGASAHVEKVWAPPAAEAAAYTVTATVHYDSAATPPLTATVRRYRTLFVPMVCK